MEGERKERLGNTRGLLPPLVPRAQPGIPAGAAVPEGEADAAHMTEHRKTTVTLALGDMEYLDELALHIRRRHRTHVNRGEIIRALIAALRASGLDLTIASGETTIRDAVVARLRG